MAHVSRLDWTVKSTIKPELWKSTPGKPNPCELREFRMLVNRRCRVVESRPPRVDVPECSNAWKSWRVDVQNLRELTFWKFRTLMNRLGPRTRDRSENQSCFSADSGEKRDRRRGLCAGGSYGKARKHLRIVYKQKYRSIFFGAIYTRHNHRTPPLVQLNRHVLDRLWNICRPSHYF